MSVMDMNSRMAMAEKLSIPQLQQAIQSGSLPAYIGIPLIEQKTKERAQMAAAQGGQEKPPSVAASILQQAEQQEQAQGINQLPSNLPVMEDEEMGMAGGGIVAFADEGQVVDPYSAYGDIDPLAQFSGLTQADVARDIQKQLKEQREKQRKADIKQREFLMRNAPGSVASFDFGAGEFEAINSPTAPTTKPEVLGSEFGVQGVLPSRETGQQGQGNQNAPTGGTPNAPSTGKVANLPVTTDEIRSQVAAGKGSALDQYAAMLMAEREGSGKERDKAKAMAIFQAGLGIMGGTSPNAFANIAQGALPATQAYQQSIKGIRAEDAARLKELMGLGVSKEKLALEAKKLGISEKRFDQMYQLEQQKIGIMGGSRADLAAERNELARERRIDTMFKNIQGTPWAIGRSPSEILRAAQEAVNAGRDVQETPAAPSGVTVRRIS